MPSPMSPALFCRSSWRDYDITPAAARQAGSSAGTRLNDASICYMMPFANAAVFRLPRPDAQQRC